MSSLMLGIDVGRAAILADELASWDGAVGDTLGLVTEAETLSDLPTNAHGPLRDIAADGSMMATAIRTASEQLTGFRLPGVVAIDNALSRAQNWQGSDNDPMLDQRVRDLRDAVEEFTESDEDTVAVMSLLFKGVAVEDAIEQVTGRNVRAEAAEVAKVNELVALEQRVATEDFPSEAARQAATTRIAELRQELGLDQPAPAPPANLTPYDAAHILMTGDQVREMVELRKDLRLNRNEHLYIDLDTDELYVLVNPGPNQKFVTVEEWAVWLFMGQDPSIAVFDPDYDPEIRYEQIEPDRWRVTFPDGTVTFMTTEEKVVMEYTHYQAFDPDIVPDYAASEYYGSWQPFNPGSMLGPIHTFLDVVGFIPVLGEPADGINALLYAAEGDWVNAGISAGALIPVLGSAGTGARLANRLGGTLLESYRATDGTIVNVIQRADGSVVEAVEATDGSVTVIARAGSDVADDVLDDAVRYAGDPPATVTVSSGHKSVQDPTFLRYGDLPPNSTFTRNGYDYVTDANGNVVSASGTLRIDPDAPRYNYYETKVGNEGLTTDDGGHLIANRFGGSSEGINLVPQDFNLNRGAYNQLEQSWADEILAGNTVHVDVDVTYPAGSTRPSEFRVRTTITQPDGDVDVVRTIFENEPGGG